MASVVVGQVGVAIAIEALTMQMRAKSESRVKLNFIFLSDVNRSCELLYRKWFHVDMQYLRGGNCTSTSGEDVGFLTH